MGIPGPGGLTYIGKVGTGFTDDDRRRLSEVLVAERQETSPFAGRLPREALPATFVTPTRVGEVQFMDWTSRGRLRAPSWRGWRTDRSPTDVVRE